MMLAMKPVSLLLLLFLVNYPRCSGKAPKKGRPVSGDRVALELRAWNPLWGFHNKSANAIFSLAVGYDIQSHNRFVGSLRRTGFSGDVVLATAPDMQTHIASYLRQQHVLCYSLSVKCVNKQCALKNLPDSTLFPLPEDKKGRQQLPMDILRWAVFRFWSREYDPGSLLAAIDFRDSVFQLDPFSGLHAERERSVDSFERVDPPTGLWLSAEHVPYKRIGTCHFNSAWIRDCFGTGALRQLAAKPVLCCGSVFGTPVALSGFASEILELSGKVTCPTPTDQGLANFLFHTGGLAHLDFHARLYPRGTGPVNTVGAFGGKRHGYYVGADLTQALQDRQGYVLDCPRRAKPAFVGCSRLAPPDSPCRHRRDGNESFADTCSQGSTSGLGQRSAVVHQWDRVARVLEPFIDKKLACRSNCTALPPW